MIKLQVKVTKEILIESMMCKSDDFQFLLSNCAVDAAVSEVNYSPFGLKVGALGCIVSNGGACGAHDGKEFIQAFDALKDTPEKRLELPETVVTLDITDKILEQISLPEMEEIVSKIDHLELV